MGRRDTFPKTLLLPVVLWLLAGCGVTNGDEPENGFGLDPPGYPFTYLEPSVSADGGVIVFHRTKVMQLDASGVFWIDYDSTGIWMVRPDGTGFELLMSGNLHTPTLSPDGQWLAFEAGAQIFKAPFDGQAVDTTGIVQLTEEGRNFSPAWSPDGEWVVYRRSYVGPEPPDVQGIWIMLNNGTGHQQLFSGNAGEGTWNPHKPQVAFFRGVINSEGQVLGDSLWVYQFDTERLDRITFLTGDNRYPKYSPDGSKIAFQSLAGREAGKIRVMNSDGTNPKPIADGAGYPSWTPDGRIVYVQGSPFPWDNIVEDYKALWIMNADGSGKRQLTFNHGMQWTQ